MSGVAQASHRKRLADGRQAAEVGDRSILIQRDVWGTPTRLDERVAMVIDRLDDLVGIPRELAVGVQDETVV